MLPGAPGGEQIVVSLVVEIEADGTVTERYLHASNCEGDIWKSSLAKEVVIEADVAEIRDWRKSFGISHSMDSHQNTKVMGVIGSKTSTGARPRCWGIINSATMPASS